MTHTIGLMDEDGFGNMGENMKSLLMDQEASARSDAGIIVMSMFFAGILIVAFTTNPIASGTKIGERAPIFSGDAYDGSSWSTFEFEDLLDSSWTWNSTEDAPWIAVEFLDTDCGYCKQSAPDVGEWAQMYSAEQWPGPDVIFIAVAVEFVADSSITEVEEFRAQYNNNFLYVDDLDNDIAGDWDVSATPTYFLVQPDGIVAWNSGQATNSLGWDAKEEQSTSLNGFDDGYVQLNEAIEQLTLLNGGE
ncbi:MAG TPA: TlpA family protein disulfide reductase [Candidatus Poseidoniaceae archaeon]|nr:TlpA family protein disulfide reductase [Candidatus Poseidoniaceae archaeon]